MKRSGLKALAGLAVGALFVFLVVRSLDWAQVKLAFAESRPLYLVPIAVLLVLHYFSKALRWRVLLKDHAAVGPIFSYRLTMIGFLMNNIFPARIGELGRPYLLSANRPGIRFSFALATVVGDKLFDLLFVIVCLLVPAAFLDIPDFVRTGVLILSAACLTIAGGGVVASIWHENDRKRPLAERRLYRVFSRFGPLGLKAYDAAQGFIEGLATVSSLKRAGMALFYSAISFALLAVVVYLTVKMVNLDAGLLNCLFVIGMIGIGFMIPAPPTNAGTFHYFGAQALVLAGIAQMEHALVFAIIAHISQVAVVTVVGAVSLIGLDWAQLSAIKQQEP